MKVLETTYHSQPVRIHYKTDPLELIMVCKPDQTGFGRDQQIMDDWAMDQLAEEFNPA